MFRCHSCQKEIEFKSPITAETLCPVCSIPVHCCLNCRFYSPTSRNQCLQIGLPRVSEKRRVNPCAAFRFRDVAPVRHDAPGETARKRLDRLFPER